MIDKKTYNREYYKAHKERRLQQQKSYYDRAKNERLAYQAEYYEKNKKRILELKHKRDEEKRKQKDTERICDGVPELGAWLPEVTV